MREATNEGDIDTTRCEWTTFGGPSQTVLQDPGVELSLGFVRKAQIRGCDTLQDVVVVLCRAENAWRWVRDIPNTQ